MNKICGIYKITSPSDKIYIGQSRSINKRKQAYKNLKCKTQPFLYNSIVKYGWNNHKFEIICECKESELNNLEAYYIKLYDTFDTDHGLNLTSGGDHCKLSKESILKSAKANRGKKRSEEIRLKLSNNFKGRKHTEKNKRILALAHLGKKHTKESIEKMRACKLGKKLSAETIQKLKIINTGKKRSAETKEKLRITKLGNKIWLGKKHSEESKTKISEARKNTYEIYNQNNELVYKFKNTLRVELKKLKLPRERFRNTYLHNEKVKNGIYKGWYIIKL